MTTLVAAPGVALHAVVEGVGAPVVLLHGHALDLRVWDETAPPLVAGGFRVIRYDQRGHGRSSSPPCEYRWGDHAADLAVVIETLGARPAHIVGLSKGGGIALELAVRRPEFARSLVLIGPLVPDFPLSPGLTGQFRALAAGIRGRGTQDALRSLWMSHPLIAPAAATPGVRERLEAMFGTFPAGEYFASRRDPPDRDWTLIERLAAIAAPILVLRGERDIPEFAAMAAFLAERVPGAALEVVPSCGHLVPLEEPAETSRAVLRFLRSAPADCTGVRP